MKSIKYLIVMAVIALSISSCYKDKGSYNTDEWTVIESVTLDTGIDGDYIISLLEGDQWQIYPEVVLKSGIDEADMEYFWILGGDTIGSEKNLDWTVVRTADMVIGDNGADFWFDIRYTKTGENWKFFPTSSYGYARMVTIVATREPKVGVMMYSKADGQIEWGSIMGSDPKVPTAFTTIFTDMYNFYNEGRTITGDYVGAAISSTLYVYTNEGPDYGALIQAVSDDDALYPLGSYSGTPAEEVYTGTPDADVKSMNVYSSYMQDLLIGDNLYVTSASNSSYQVVFPGSTPTQEGVVQVMGAKPYFNLMYFAAQLTTDSEVYYYNYSDSRGYDRVALLDADNQVVTADQIVGVFRQPSFIEKQVKIFVVVESAGSYYLYAYTQNVQSGNVSDIITFVSKTDVTSWAGGITDSSIWTTNVVEVSYNGLYIANGTGIWRTSYEALETPTLIKSFDNPIVSMDVIPSATSGGSDDSYEVYTAVFTYDDSADESEMFVLDFKTETLDELTTMENTIPGKVLQYLPKY